LETLKHYFALALKAIMSNNNAKKTTKEIGNAAEMAAAEYLQAKGYTVLVTNYRYRRGEIDIIASKEDLLIFVEVKYRRSTGFGEPENAVTPEKENLIQETAEHYVINTGYAGNIRFDIIAVECIMGRYGITHFEDAF
jgi:putative endonuclease